MSFLCIIVICFNPRFYLTKSFFVMIMTIFVDAHRRDDEYLKGNFTINWPFTPRMVLLTNNSLQRMSAREKPICSSTSFTSQIFFNYITSPTMFELNKWDLTFLILFEIVQETIQPNLVFWFFLNILFPQVFKTKKRYMSISISCNEWKSALIFFTLNLSV